MTFGLFNALAMFQRLTERSMGDQGLHYYLLYLDIRSFLIHIRKAHGRTTGCVECLRALTHLSISNSAFPTLDM